MTKEERLISALIGLVRAAEGNEDLITAETDRLIIDSLATLHERRGRRAGLLPAASSVPCLAGGQATTICPIF